MSIRGTPIHHGRISAGSIRLDNIGSKNEKNLVVNEYEVETTPEKITNPLNHYKGLCKMPSWLVFLIANGILLICIVSLGVVLGLTLTKTASGGTCTKDADCDSTIGLICSAGTCACSTAKYWDDTQQMCTTKKKMNSSCSSAKECDDRIVLTCLDSNSNQINTTILGTGVCACASSLYWNGTSCIVISSSNGGCNPSLSFTGCDKSLGLYCDNSTKKCVCDTSKQYWSGSSCTNYKVYLDGCIDSTWCSPNTNLYCEVQGTYAGKCTCPTKTYWDGSKCTNVATLAGACTTTQQCDTSLGLTCSATTSKCECLSNDYWTGSTCVSKLSIGGSCVSNITCDDTLLLYCSGGSCTCLSTHYWDTYSLSCLPKKVVSGSCTSSLTCDTSANLICSGSGSSVGSCACPTTSFWNGTACTLKFSWKVSCAASIQCNDFLSLVCTNTSSYSTNFICDCSNSKYYFDGSSCSSKKTNLSPCGSSYECQDYNLLICSGLKCVCPDTHYWDGSTCAQKRLYTVPCLSTSQCDDLRYLYCPTTIGGCDCPFISTGYYCDCNTTSYWDATATTCTPRGSYQSSCPLGNYQCLTAGTGLSCTSGICDCPPASSGWFWTGTECKQCPSGWTIAGNYCYYKTTFQTNWDTAQQYCKTFAGTLMVINDATELSSFQNTGFLTSGSTANIGVNSQIVAGSWFWETGASLSKTSSWWCSGLGTDQCGAIYNNNGVFCITDVPCSSTFVSICEIY